MRLTPILAACLLCPALAVAGPCKVPAYEDFAAGKHPPVADALRVVMQPIAQLSVPSGFGKINVLPHGSVGFGQHPKDVTAVLLFETKGSVSSYQKGAMPAPFFLSVFRGLDAAGCRRLHTYDLAAEDYRLHAQLAQGTELFAHGKGEDHQFYVIRADKPHLVLTGLFKNISRAEFESILSTLVLE